MLVIVLYIKLKFANIYIFQNPQATTARGPNESL